MANEGEGESRRFKLCSGMRDRLTGNGYHVITLSRAQATLHLSLPARNY
jgi:hypothetical protein